MIENKNAAVENTLIHFMARQLKAHNLSQPLQKHFLDLVAKFSQTLSQGHSCLVISNQVDRSCLQQTAALTTLISCASSGLKTPLIFEMTDSDWRLYFHRYWRYECRLAENILQKNEKHSGRKGRPEERVIESALARYFPESASDQVQAVDYQKLAVQRSLNQGFSIITGGPGTGKTTTVVKALAMLLEQEPTLNIALAAPTGKAAMRLSESIGEGIERLACKPEIRKKIPLQVVTLHRLLGAIHQSPSFKHNHANPLPYDVVVIDEASMIDLAMMAKLLDAVTPQAKVLLLGDQDQLASVEAGSVLADLTQALPDNTHHLRVSHRFQGDIKILADLVNQKQAEASWLLLLEKASDSGAIGCVANDIHDVVDYASARMQAYLTLLDQWSSEAVEEAISPQFQHLMEAFLAFQILCSNVQGSLGVLSVNQAIFERFYRSDLAEHSPQNSPERWFHGRPILVQENMPSLGLSNGDIGLCLETNVAQGTQLMVWFSDAEGKVKRVLPSRMPKHQTAYAMTVHKSQGSEFSEVLMVLSDQKDNSVLSKELVYTAITRAKKRIVIAANELVWKQAVTKRVKRYSGLQTRF